MTVYFNTVHYIMYIYIYICSAHSDPYLYCWPNFRINGEASWQRLKKRTMHLTNYSVSRPGMSCWIGQKVVVLRNLSFVLNLGSTFGSFWTWDAWSWTDFWLFRTWSVLKFQGTPAWLELISPISHIRSNIFGRGNSEGWICSLRWKLILYMAESTSA